MKIKVVGCLGVAGLWALLAGSVRAADFYWSGNSGSSDNIDQGANWWSGSNPSSGDNLYFNNTAGARHWPYSNYGAGSWFGNIITYTGAGGIKWRGDATYVYKFENNNDGNLFEIEANIGNRTGNDLQLNPVGAGGIKVDNTVFLDGSQWIQVYGNNTLEIDGMITNVAGGTSGVQINSGNTPTVLLYGTNVFTGGMNILGGSLLIGSNGMLGASGIYSGAISNTATLKVATTQSQMLGGVISGAGSLIKTNSGTLTLTNANTFSGGLTVGQGTVNLNNSWAAGSGTLTLAGGTIQVTNASTTVSNNIVAQSGTTSTLQISSFDLTLAGNLSGTGSLTTAYSGSGVHAMQLGGTNNGYAGACTVNNNGSVRFRFLSSQAGSSNAVWVFNNNTTDGESFNFGNGTIYFGSFSGGGQFRQDTAGTTILTVGALGSNDTFSGTLNQANASSLLSLTKVGTGTLTLSGANTFSGGTTVERGILSLGYASSGTGTLRNNTLTINGGATVKTTVGDALGYTSGSCVTNVNIVGGTLDNAVSGNNGYITTFNLMGGLMTNSVANTGVQGFNFNGASGAINSLATNVVSTISAPVVLRANGLVITTAQGTVPGGIDLTISGPIIPNGGTIWTKAGAGNLNLSGANTFNGAVTNSAGTLTLGSTTALGTSAATLVMAGGNLDSSVADLSIANNNPQSWNADFTFAGSQNLNLGRGTVTLGASRQVTVSANTLTVGGTITGTGYGLTKAGAGTLSLAGGGTYTGGTTVNGGTLKGMPAPLLYLSFDNVSGTTVVNQGSGGATMNGTLTGAGATITSGGRHGNALSINGTSGSYVKINNKVTALDCNAGGSPWTYTLWIKTSTAGAVYGYQGAGAWNGTAQTTFYLNQNSGTAGGTKAGGVRYGDAWLTGTTALNDGNWHHVAITVSNSVKTIYVDGNVDAQTGTTGWTAAGSGTANQFWIGGSPDSGDGTAYLNGLIDEVAVYNTALSQGAVQMIMSNEMASLPAGAISVAASSTLDLNGSSLMASSLTGPGTIDTTLAGSSPIVTVSNNATTTFNGVLANTAGSLSLLSAGSGTLTLSGANTYSGSTLINAGTVALSGSGTLGSGAALVLSGGALDLGALSRSVGAVTITAAAASGDTIRNGNLTGSSYAASLTTGNAMISAGLQGSGVALTKTGAGTLTLSGASTYSGGTTLSAGMLVAGNSSAFGSGTVTNTSTTGILDLNGQGIGNALYNSGTGFVITNSSASTATVSSGFNNAGAAGVILSDFTVTGNGDILWTGAVNRTSGGGTLTKNGGNTVTINGSATWAGMNLTINAGTLVFGKTSAACVSDPVINGGTLKMDPNYQVASANIWSGFIANTMTMNGGTWDLNGTGTNGVNNRFKRINGTGGVITNSSASAARINVAFRDGANCSWSGSIQDGAAGAISVYLQNGGSAGCALTNSGNNTYHGVTSLSDNALVAGSGTAFSPNSAFTLANNSGAKLDLNNFNNTIGSLAGGGASGGNVLTGTGAGGTLTCGGDNTSTSYGGVISGNGGLIKTGTGTLTLSGTQTFSGGTTVSNGTLTVNGSLAGTALVAAGATLGGGGSVAGVVTVNGAGRAGLTNGAAETLTVGGLSLDNGSVMIFDLGTSSDKVISGGAVSANGAAIAINPTAGFAMGTYTLIQGNVTSTNGFTVASVAPNGTRYRLNCDGSNLQLVYEYSQLPAAYWKGDVDGVWTNSPNWTTNKAGTAGIAGILPGQYSAVTLTASGAGNPGTVLGGDFTIETLTFDNTGAVGIGGANTLTINGGLVVSNGAAAATISNDTTVALGGSQTWTHNGANALTVNGVISGSAKALTKAGTGTLFLSGTNTYSGGTVVSNGLVVINNTNSTGFGTLTLAGGNISNSVALGFTNALALANAATLNTANALTLGGVISGAGGLTKSGAATVTLAGATNTYAGGTTISAGTLALGTDYGANENGCALGSGPVTVGSGTQLRFGGAGGALQNFTITNAITLNGGSLYVVDGAQYLTGALTVNSNTLCYANWRTKSLVFGGVMSGSGAISFADDQWNAGDFAELHVANPDNTYSGTVGINPSQNGAQLSVDTNNALAGATVALNGFSLCTGLVFGANAPAPVLGALSGTGQVSVAGAGLSVGNNNANNAFYGNISGAGSLTKTGTGIWTLSGTNTYSGTTTVSAGKLVVNGLMPTNTLTVAANAALAGTGTVYGAVTLQSGALINLTNGVGGTLTLTNGLTLAGAHVMNFDLGTAANADKIAVTGGAYSRVGTVTINITKLSGYAAGTNDLITTTGSQITTPDGFVLGTVPVGYGFVLISDGAGKLQVVSTNNSAPAAFWKGGTDANWETLSNWATDIAGTPATLPVGPISTVTLTTTNAATLDTVLTEDLAIDRLVVNSNGLAAVSSISGSGVLTLQSGLVMSNGANSLVVSNPVGLAASQVWSNTSAVGTVTVAGAISGSGASLQLGGTGKFNFKGSSTYDGGTVLSNSATLMLGHATDTLADSAPVTVAGGTLDIGANNDTMGVVTLGSGSITGASGTLVGSSYVVQSGTIAATLGGTAAMTKNVAGTVTITSSNAYSGGTTLGAGTVNVQNNNAFGTGAITLNGGTIEDPGNIVLTNAIVAQSGSSSTLRVINSSANGNDLQINGNITGNGNIALDNSGTWYNGVKLGGDNSGYIGTVTISGYSQARHKFTAATAGSSNAFWNWTTTATDCGSPSFTSGTLYLGALAGNGSPRLPNSGIVVEIGGLNTNSTWSGNLGQSGGPGNVRKVGTGTLTFSGGNQYTGYTEVQAGTLAYGANNAISDSSSVRITGGTLAMNSYNDTVAGVQLVSGSITGTGGTLTSSSHYILESGTVSAILGGTKAIYKTNTGVVALSGANTYGGGTTNANGTLAINVPGALSTGPLVLTGGALDNTSGSNVTVSTDNYQVWDADVAFTGTTNLNLGAGTVKLSANRNVTVSANTLTLGGAVTGAYALVKSGAGTLTLGSAASTYGGGTTVSNGVLRLGAPNALGPTTNTLTVTAGTVDLYGNDLGVGALTQGATAGTILNNGGAAAILTVGNGNIGSTSEVVLSNGVSALAVVKTGSGTWIAKGANSHSGGTTLSAGTLDIWNSSAAGSGTLTLAGGVLQNTSGSQVTIGNTVVAQVGTTTSLHGTGASNGNGLTFTGNISGSGSLVMDSDASWYPYVNLNGDNSGFTGTFTVNGNGQSRMGFGGANSGSSGAAWVLNNNADDCPRFNFTGTIKFGSLSGTGGWGVRSSGAVTFEVGALNSSTTFNGTLGGKWVLSASLTKVGSGTLTLAGNNTYSGATVVSNGNLEVNGGIGGSGTTVNPGAKLAGSGTISSLVTLDPGNAAISLTNAATATLTLANGLTLNNGNVLNFDLGTPDGSHNDKIAMTGGTYTRNAGTVTVNVAAISGFGVGAYDLITGIGISDASGFTVGAMPQGYFGVPVASSGNLRLQVYELTGAVFSIR